MEQALSGTVDAKLPRIPPIAEPLPADAVDNRPERAVRLQLLGLGREHRQAGVTSHLCRHLDQSRLADPGLAFDNYEPAPAWQGANDLLERGQLSPAPNERGLRNSIHPAPLHSLGSQPLRRIRPSVGSGTRPHSQPFLGLWRAAGYREERYAAIWLAGRGLSNAEIGSRLYLSEATIKGHITRILARLGCAIAYKSPSL